MCDACIKREAASALKQDDRRYTIYIERDAFADTEQYPDGIAWRSGILDEKDEEIDGEGDIATYEEAEGLAVSTLLRLLGHEDTKGLDAIKGCSECHYQPCIEHDTI